MSKPTLVWIELTSDCHRMVNLKIDPWYLAPIEKDCHGLWADRAVGLWADLASKVLWLKLLSVTWFEGHFWIHDGEPKNSRNAEAHHECTANFWWWSIKTFSLANKNRAGLACWSLSIILGKGILSSNRCFCFLKFAWFGSLRLPNFLH